MSVILSIYLYTTNDDKSLGIFVGLWAPTLMSLSNRFAIEEASEMAAATIGFFSRGKWKDDSADRLIDFS